MPDLLSSRTVFQLFSLFPHPPPPAHTSSTEAETHVIDEKAKEKLFPLFFSALTLPSTFLLFLCVLVPFLLDGKFAKWFMRSSSADNKSFLSGEAFLLDVLRENAKNSGDWDGRRWSETRVALFRMITYWIFKPHLKHINSDDWLGKTFHPFPFACWKRKLNQSKWCLETCVRDHMDEESWEGKESSSRRFFPRSTRFFIRIVHINHESERKKEFYVTAQRLLPRLPWFLFKFAGKFT